MDVEDLHVQALSNFDIDNVAIDTNLISALIYAIGSSRRTSVGMLRRLLPLRYERALQVALVLSL